MTNALAIPKSFPAPRPQSALTLLDLVVELSAAGGSEQEVAFAVLDLVGSGRVRLLGQICDEDLLPPVLEH